MTEISVADSEIISRIRSEFHENIRFFCAVDVVAELLNADKKQAQNYYYVLKTRLLKNKIPLDVLRIKVRANDDKYYLTDFVDITGFTIIQDYIKTNLQKRHIRIHQRKDDEVANFQPVVVKHLENNGFSVQQYVRLNSGRVIDIVAKQNELLFIVECKPRLSGAKLYTAIGQVLCYRAEYQPSAVPNIATHADEVTNYARQACIATGVGLIGIPVT